MHCQRRCQPPTAVSAANGADVGRTPRAATKPPADDADGTDDTDDTEGALQAACGLDALQAAYGLKAACGLGTLAVPRVHPRGNRGRVERRSRVSCRFRDGECLPRRLADLDAVLHDDAWCLRRRPHDPARAAVHNVVHVNLCIGEVAKHRADRNAPSDGRTSRERWGRGAVPEERHDAERTTPSRRQGKSVGGSGTPLDTCPGGR